jgi:hypothetical protein
MEEQRALASSLAPSELLGRVNGEVDPVGKAEVARAVGRESGRVISEPSSIKIPAGDGKTPREARGKPALKKPPKELAAYRAFRGLCDEILNELRQIDVFLVGDEVNDEGAAVVVEVEELLERLYNCPFGQGESLKRVVVAVQSQVNNVPWARRHVEFLKEIVRYLRVRYLVDEASVHACYEMMKARGLDPFRGTVCEPRVVKRYRLEEVKDP